MVYKFTAYSFSRVCSYVDDFNNRNLFLTAKLLQQVYIIDHKTLKAFSNYYHRHSELIVKYSIFVYCYSHCGSCNCSMFCCTLLYVHFSIAIILMGKRELIALLKLSSWCLVMVERLFLAVARGCLQFVIVLFPDHTHLLFLV